MEERLDQGLETFDGEVVFQAARIDLAIDAEHEPFLVFVEGDIVLDGRFFAGVRIDVEEALDHLVPFHRLRDDLGDVFRLHLKVADPLGILDDNGPLLTETVAPRPPEGHLAGEPLTLDLLLYRSGNLPAARGMAGAAGAKGEAGLGRIPLGEDLLAEDVKFGW